jgi:glycosyltransferase involved in cell wall biosynthesis
MSTTVEKLSCVFPAFNEEQNIGPLLDEALSTLGRFAPTFEVIVVDDGSSDRTGDIVREYGERHPEVRLVAHPTNLGYGHAVRSGLSSVQGDAAVFIDGDRQFRIADAEALLAKLNGAQVVIGRRIKRADPWHRLLIAKVYHRVLHASFGVLVHDVDCGFKLFHREVLDKIVPQLESRSAFISPELVIRAKIAGFTVGEADVPHYARVAGRPKGATPKVIARTLGEIWRLRRSLGRDSSL